MKEKKKRIGFKFSPFQEEKKSSFETLFDIFKELITHTSGDLEEALAWLAELDKEYKLTTPEYTLEDFEDDLKKKGYIQERIAPDGTSDKKITAKTERAIRKNALNQIFGKLKKQGIGNHKTKFTGFGDEHTGELRNFQFGDGLEHISVTESLKNAQINHGFDNFKLTENDLIVEDTHHKSQMSTVLMIDISHSMILYGEDRITPAKKVAMALAELITTRYPKDTLDILVFGNDAWPIPIKDLPYLQVGPYHTNTVAGLELAMDLLRRKRNTNKHIFMITDGKPSCIRMPDGTYYKNSNGLDDFIVEKCYNMAAHARKLHIPITTFMIAQDPYLQSFVEQFTLSNRGKAFYTGLEGLGEMIFHDYENNRKKKIKIMNTSIKTIGELRVAKYVSKSIKEELRANLIQNIKNGKSSFKGIHGYENTVIPQLERAILSQHNINFLGLRGQAKTRLARLMVELLDEYIPAIEGSEINDDPFAPISLYGQEQVAKLGDKTSIKWIHRTERFYEKLATPDVTISDLIGDIDPIKAANLKLSYADERVIHYGMIPRANRSIFVINELPDLQARIQVALFNILEEGDIQIRGFKLRMPLDLQFIFTANPEDYTNRGSIVTPLKDRIGSQILTHYPESLEIAKAITAQEAKLQNDRMCKIHVPNLVKDLVEQIGFEARESEYVDSKSGISARMSITAYENLLSTAEHRCMISGSKETSIRFADVLGMVPSITGKVELVYEGEQEGVAFVAEKLIGEAAKTLFSQYFPKSKKLKHDNEKDPYDELLQWFFEESSFELLDDATENEYADGLNKILPLNSLIETYVPSVNEKDKLFLKEFILWAMVEYNKLNKQRITKGFSFKDTYGAFLSGI